MAPTAKWTFMVYMAGDNNLSEAGENDLKEMRTVGSTPDVNIVTEFDRIGSESQTVRYHIQQGGANEQPFELGETDCGDPNVLLNFVTWAAKNYPAERYALVLWNHGSGWEPSEMDRVARSVDAQNYHQREITQRASSPLRRVLFRTTLEEVFELETPEQRAICSDDGTGHSLDTVELGNVLRQATEAIGRPLDLLGMDACLMSNIEVAYQAKPFARYMVASEELEPNDGWPYDVVLRTLVDHPDLTTAEVASHIVNSYVTSYTDINYPGAVTQAAYDLSRADAFAQPVNQLAGVLAGSMPKVKRKLRDAQLESANFYSHTLWDLNDLSAELSRRTRDKNLRAAIKAVQAALAEGADKFVIAEGHSGKSVAQCKGVSIYLPLHSDVSQYYSELDFARDNRWAAMLQAYHA